MVFMKKTKKEDGRKKEQTEIDNESREGTHFTNPLDWLKKKAEDKEEELAAISSLAPFRVKQKLLIWNSGRGQRIFGYPVAMIPQHEEDEFYVILYKRRRPTFFGEMLATIKEVLFGIKERYRVVLVPAGCVDMSEEIITIYAHSFKIVNNYTEIALPLEGNDPRKRELYISALAQAHSTKAIFHRYLNDMPEVMEMALYLNPAVKVYYGTEMYTDRHKGSRIKEFGGREVEFSFPRFIEDLRREFGGKYDR